MRGVIVAILVAGGCSRADAPGPRSIDAPALVRAVAELRAAAEPEVRGEAFGAEVDRLRTLIVAGGDALHHAARDALDDDDAERRLRAGLVLQTSPLDEVFLAGQAASDDPRRWAWAVLSEDGFPRLAEPVDRSHAGDVREARALFDRCAPELRALLTNDAARLAELTPEYAEAHRRVLLPKLDRPGDHAHPRFVRRADLDGDDVDDWCVVGVIEDGSVEWKFLLVVDGASERVLRSLAYDAIDRPSRLACYDVDRDARPELVEEVAVVGGWTWQRIRVHDLDRAQPVEWGGRRAFTLRDPHRDDVWFVHGDAFNPYPGGKAVYLVTSYGSEFRLSRLARDGSIAAEIAVHTAVSTW